MFLDELPEGRGIYESEPAIECGIGCATAMADIDQYAAEQRKGE
jgi:hypothetical protein